MIIECDPRDSTLRQSQAEGLPLPVQIPGPQRVRWGEWGTVLSSGLKALAVSVSDLCRFCQKMWETWVQGTAAWVSTLAKGARFP